MTQIIFYIFATIAVLGAMMVVASRNPVHGTLSLVLTFFAMAAIWLLLHAEFLALILVLVYVGAVMTLFLFVVMMLRIHVVQRDKAYVRYVPLVGLFVLLLVAIMIRTLIHDQVPAVAATAENLNNINALGMVLYTYYVYPFEIAAVILLAAIIAAISLTHRAPRHRKSQNPSAQVAVRRADRVRLVNMPTTPRQKPNTGPSV